MNLFNPSKEEFAALLQEASPLIEHFFENNHFSHNFSSPSPLLGNLKETSSLQKLIEDFQNSFYSGINTAGQSYMGFIPGGGLPLAALFEMIFSLYNRYLGVPFAAPELLNLEMESIKWHFPLFDFSPHTSQGLFTSGGTQSNLMAFQVAKQKLYEEEDLYRCTVYTSNQTHLSVIKTAKAAGILSKNIRSIATHNDGTINLQELSWTIEEDRKKNLLPFFLSANAGTTNTGSIDNLLQMALIAKAQHLHFHIDAAYGGYYALTKKGAALFKGIEHADTLTLDPHKSLFFPYGTGLLLIQNHLGKSASLKEKENYLTNNYFSPEAVKELWDFNELSLELTRPPRGCVFYFTMKILGQQRFVDCLEERIQLTSALHKELQQLSSLKIFPYSGLSLVAFHYQNNQETKDLHQRILSHEQFFLSTTEIQGLTYIRVCINSFRTTKDDIVKLLKQIKAEIKTEVDRSHKQRMSS